MKNVLVLIFLKLYIKKINVKESEIRMSNDENFKKKEY